MFTRTEKKLSKSSSRYEQTVEESFHVSKACLELPTPGSPPKGVTTLYVECEGEEFILSHLGAPGEGVGVLADNLDLNFVAGEKICFRTSVRTVPARVVVPSQPILVPLEPHR